MTTGQRLHANSVPATSLEATSICLESLMADALVQLDAGHTEEALAGFEQVIALDHHYVPALLGAAMVCADKEQHARAFEFYEQVVSLEPKHAMAWNGRGLAAFNLERMDEAVASFERSVEDQPINGFFYEALAWSEMCANKTASAIQSAKESLLMYSQTDASSIYPTLIIYFCALELNDIKNAQRALRYAVKNHEPKQWPAPVIYYLNDSIDSRELLSCVVNSRKRLRRTFTSDCGCCTKISRIKRCFIYNGRLNLEMRQSLSTQQMSGEATVFQPNNSSGSAVLCAYAQVCLNQRKKAIAVLVK